MQLLCTPVHIKTSDEDDEELLRASLECIVWRPLARTFLEQGEACGGLALPHIYRRLVLCADKNEPV